MRVALKLKGPGIIIYRFILLIVHGIQCLRASQGRVLPIIKEGEIKVFER